MFRRDPSPTFAIQVPLREPGTDAPKLLGLTCRHLGRKALDVWLRSAADAAAAGQPITDGQWLSHVIATWDVVGADDVPLPVSHETLDAFFDDYHGAAQAFVDAYLAELVEGRRKNW